MENLTVEQLSFAVATLENLVNARGLTQTQLEHLSGVKQSQISKTLSRQADPSPEVLVKLFKALGLNLDDILHDAPISSVNELLGYLATPLTAVVSLPGQNAELERVVSELRRCASAEEFLNPRFNLYWPGDYTHPTRHPDFRPNQVYVTDRSRASTFDFCVGINHARFIEPLPSPVTRPGPAASESKTLSSSRPTNCAGCFRLPRRRAAATTR